MTVPAQPASGPQAPGPQPVGVPAPPAASGSNWVLAPVQPPPATTSAPVFYPAATYPSARAATSRPSAPPYDPYVRRPLVLEAHTSLGGPIGWFGVGVDYSLARHFSIMGGAGLGQYGPQVGGMARLRLPMETVSAGFGAGLSAGEYEDGFLSGGDRFRWDTAYWFNAEGFIEIRTKRGVNIRPYMGSGVLLNRTDGVPVSPDIQCTGVPGQTQSCGEVSPSRDRNPFLFYMGAAFGYAFQL